MEYGVHNCIYTIGYGYIGYDMDMYDMHGFISVHTIQDMGVCCTLQHTATHCNALQRTATHCNTLQHTATHCSVHTIQDMGFIIVHII